MACVSWVLKWLTTWNTALSEYLCSFHYEDATAIYIECTDHKEYTVYTVYTVYTEYTVYT
jgi:hypothetical protein